MTQQPRELLIEQIVPEYRSWLRKLASGLLSPGHEALDDLVQEGSIAMWRACGSFDPDASTADYWLKRSAHQRMLTVIVRNHWTGQAKRAPGARPERPVASLDGLRAGTDEPLDVEDVLAAYAVENAYLAYHDGEIGRALQLLTARERDYVVARFWGGLTTVELSARLGTFAGNVWRTARPKLVASLAHLVST